MYIQVILLYLADDIKTKAYINEFKEHIDELTSGNVVFVIADEVEKGETSNIAKEIGKGRFKNITWTDFPCLLIEVSNNSKQDSFVLPLFDNEDAIKKSLRIIVDASENTHSFKELKDKVMSETSHPNSKLEVPLWFPIAGFVCIAFFIIFLSGLIVADIRGYPVPSTARMLVVFLMSVVLAAGFSFVGGKALADGTLPLPWGKDSPIKFAVTGGIGVFVLSVLIGYMTYANQSVSMESSKKSGEQTSSSAKL